MAKMSVIVEQAMFTIKDLIDDWARLIRRWSSGFSRHWPPHGGTPARAEISLTDLPAPGLQLLDEFEAGGVRQVQSFKAGQAHAAHHKFQKSLAAKSKEDEAARVLRRHCSMPTRLRLSPGSRHWTTRCSTPSRASPRCWPTCISFGPR